MHLTPGEKERLKYLFNFFLSAQRRCSETTENGRLKKHVYAAFVIAFGYVLGDDGEFEKNLQMFIDDINSFGEVNQTMWTPENN